jgi:hypothetical protein
MRRAVVGRLFRSKNGFDLMNASLDPMNEGFDSMNALEILLVE